MAVEILRSINKKHYESQLLYTGTIVINYGLDCDVKGHWHIAQLSRQLQDKAKKYQRCFHRQQTSQREKSYIKTRHYIDLFTSISLSEPSVNKMMITEQTNSAVPIWCDFKKVWSTLVAARDIEFWFLLSMVRTKYCQ